MAVLTPGPLVMDHVSFSTNSRIVAALATLAGSQIIFLGLLAKYVAHTQQVFEDNRHFVEKFQRFNRLYAIPAGLLLLVAGGLAVAYAFGAWSKTGFGAFGGAQADRLLAPAATLSVLGLQMISCAFFSMLLDIARRR